MCLPFAPGHRGAARRVRGSRGVGEVRAMSPAGCRTRGSEVRVPAELCAWWKAQPAEVEIPAENSTSCFPCCLCALLGWCLVEQGLCSWLFSQRGVKSITLCAGGSCLNSPHLRRGAKLTA